MAMMGATIEAALAAERKSVPSRDIKFLVFHVFLVVICSGVVVPARTSAGASESFMMIQDPISSSLFSRSGQKHKEIQYQSLVRRMR